MANIPDPNFRLTLLQSLWSAGLAPAFDKEAFYRQVLKVPYDFRAPYNAAVDDRIRQALLSEPISDQELAELEVIHWDGGDEVHHLIWTNWDGEDDTFDVRNLRGIEACKSLERLEFTSGLQSSDLGPLAGLQSLREVMLYGRPFDSIELPLSLPALKKVSLYYTDKPENRQALADLSARGVDVSGARAR